MELPDELSIFGVRYVREDAADKGGIERWYSVSELAEMSGFSKSSIYRAMSDGRLAFKCPSNSGIGRRISLSSWQTFLSES